MPRSWLGSVLAFETVDWPQYRFLLPRSGAPPATQRDAFPLAPAPSLAPNFSAIPGLLAVARASAPYLPLAET